LFKIACIVLHNYDVLCTTAYILPIVENLLPPITSLPSRHLTQFRPKDATVPTYNIYIYGRVNCIIQCHVIIIHTKRFQNCVGFEYLLFDPRAHVAGYRAQILQNKFGGFRLARSTLARYHARLIDVTGLQTVVGRFRHGKHVRFQNADFRSVILKHVVL